MFFVCISRSRGKLIWPNCLCHRSISDSTFCPFANIVVPTSFVSRINILHSRRPCAMTLPSSSMKHPRCVNRTCIFLSTICPTNTKFFVIVEMCRTFINFPFCPTWFMGVSLTCSMVWYVRCRHWFRRPPAVPASPNVRTTLRGSSCDSTPWNLRTTPRSASRCSLPSNWPCPSSQRLGPIRLLSSLLRSAIFDAYLRLPGSIRLCSN